MRGGIPASRSSESQRVERPLPDHAELRSQYSLGYRPDSPAERGEFREIEVRTKRGEARTKPGYFGQ